jgi:hypothetical protein
MNLTKRLRHVAACDCTATPRLTLSGITLSSLPPLLPGNCLPLVLTPSILDYYFKHGAF